MSQKVLFVVFLTLAASNALYFQLKSGESKWFLYDLTQKAVYVGEYQLLDQVPNLQATGDGVRVNFYEPEGNGFGKSYYTKIFMNKENQVLPFPLKSH